MLKITYFIPVFSFSVVTTLLGDWLNYVRNEYSYSMLAKEEFKSSFESNLKMMTNNIVDEIEQYDLWKIGLYSPS